MSDLGLVTKASPGQLVMFAANRFTGEPAPAGCPAQVIANRAVVATGAIAADGTYEAAVPDTRPDDVVAVVRCGKQVAATDPGGWMFQQNARDLAGYVYTDKPIYRPGHTVNIKGVLRWRTGDALAPFDRKQVEVSIADPNDKVVYRQQAAGGRVRRGARVVRAARGARPSATTASAIASGDDEATGSFEVQEYRKPEFEVIVKPAARFVVQGGKAVGHDHRPLLLRPAGRQRHRQVRRPQAAVLLAACAGPTAARTRTSGSRGGSAGRRRAKARRGSTRRGRRRSRCRSIRRTTATRRSPATTPPASRLASPTRAAAR